MLETPAIVSAVDCAFFNVIALDELVVVISWLGNTSALAESVTGRTPEPVKDTVCGLPGALSLTLSVPETGPPVVGVNVTEIVQLELAARVDGDNGQFDVWPKFADVAILAMVTGVV